MNIHDISENKKSFASYFIDTLNFLPIQQKNILQAFVLGLAQVMDSSKSDLFYTVHQFIPALADKKNAELITQHALSRGIYRVQGESDEGYFNRLVQAYFFHKNIGTAQGLINIFALYGYDNIKIEVKSFPRWAEFMLNVDDMPCLPSVETIKTLHNLANDFKPARSRMVRVFNTEGDTRNFLWTKQSKYSRYYWSHVLGNPIVNDDGSVTVVSLGQRHKALYDYFGQTSISSSFDSSLSVLIKRIGYFLWSYSYWGDNYALRGGTSFLSEYVKHYENKAKPWFLHTRSFSRESLTWSEENATQSRVGVWGDINARWGNGVSYVFPKTTWSQYHWSKSKGQPFIVSHERKASKDYFYAENENIPSYSAYSYLEKSKEIKRKYAWTWSHALWSEKVVPLHGTFAIHEQYAQACAYTDKDWKLRHRSSSRESMVYSDKAEAWSDINTRWSKGFSTLLTSPEWGKMRYSNGSDVIVTSSLWGKTKWSSLVKKIKYTGKGKVASQYAKHVTQVIHERFKENHTFSAQNKKEITSLFFPSSQLGQLYTLHSKQKWSGNWSQKPWSEYSIITNIISEFEGFE